ncbi:radical activating enzyme [Catellatospora sp. TT07R-123]|uniref:4Fe-4S single cluster domain-containing protein n=1 Tax=Catellatospora sp. TT07R-123 TaxID=2733863 RepID=UPI001B0AD0C0|nr:4Fe-4S single cluster domain-containing protein [Catellatospora sp. TT07R-123]GHJ48964.1 radical activating enzyme [Catellatospora sp. TT07R-123]
MSDVLRLTRAHFPVTALGYGTRLGIWLQGCPLACPGCIAKDTWDPDGGTAVGVGELLGDVRRAIAAGADGVTVSGGEPLEQAAPLAAFLLGVRELAAAAGSGFDVLLYTGFEPAELDADRRAAADLADVLITGRYVVTEPTGLIWRGSANQRMLLQTPLAELRYAAYLDHEPDTPPIQVETTSDGRAWWVGVPNRPGTKQEVESALASLGYTVESVSWRRPR